MLDFLPFEPIFLLPISWCLLMVVLTVGWLIAQLYQTYEYRVDLVQQGMELAPGPLPIDADAPALVPLGNFDLPCVARNTAQNTDQSDTSILAASVANGCPITVSVSSSGARTISRRSASPYIGLVEEIDDRRSRPPSSASCSSSGRGSGGSGFNDEEVATAVVAGREAKISSGSQTACPSKSSRLRLVRRIGKHCSRRPKRRDPQCVPSYEMMQITLRDKLQATFSFLNITFVDIYVQLSSKPPSLGGLLLAGAQFGYFVLMYGTASLVLMCNPSPTAKINRRGKSETRLQLAEPISEFGKMD